MTTAAAKHPSVHWLAWVALACSLVAALLALYGSMYAEKHIAGSPLREARGSAGLPAVPVRWWDRVLDSGERTLFGESLDRKVLALTERSATARHALQFVAYVLPFLLGIAGGVVGGRAMSVIERGGGRYGGNLAGVFAILIGLFAAVIAGCMLVSQFAWAWVPGGYTA